MEKSFPSQEKVRFFAQKGKRILKDPFRIPIFPGVVNQRPKQREGL
jgi:hypothetical protein